MIRYRGHRITIARSTLCGFAAWRYDITDSGVPAGHGFYTGSFEQAERYAKRAVDNRLAQGEQQGVN